MELPVNLGKNSYQIHIENGCLDHAGQLIRKVVKTGKCALITDSNVDGLYCERVVRSLREQGIEAVRLAFPAGEASKNLQTLSDIYAFLVAQHINRGDFILALGGGVTGDTAGFAAATYMRGIPYVQIPTTLLAQVDSSVGGKVAVDLPEGKNMVGNFHHPKLVLIDPLVLDTLPPEFFTDGMAEVIKYGCIRDEGLFALLEGLEPDGLREKLPEIIYRCVDIKRQMVERDERDTGERMLLNFGHTVGHAVEKYYHYEGITHGMAVAIGMYQMTCAGERAGLTESETAVRLLRCLEKYRLPHEAEEACMKMVPKYAAGDKKNFGSQLSIVALRRMGEAFVHPMPLGAFSRFLTGAIE